MKTTATAKIGAVASDRLPVERSNGKKGMTQVTIR